MPWCAGLHVVANSAHDLQREIASFNCVVGCEAGCAWSRVCAAPQVCHTRPYIFLDVSCRDVLHQNFEGYKPEVQELICVADRLGSLMQYETPGFLPNKRIHRGILET